MELFLLLLMSTAGIGTVSLVYMLSLKDIIKDKDSDYTEFEKIVEDIIHYKYLE